MTPPVDIICFAKDWGEPKTANNHVVAELAKRHRVLWVNPVATRNPNLVSANDVRKILRRVLGWFAGVEVIHDRLRVLNPVSLPFPHSRLAEWLNHFLVSSAVQSAAKRWGFHRPQLWIFPPNAVDYVGRFGEDLVVYYCVDEWSEFSHINTAYMQQKEVVLLQTADVVFAVSHELVSSKSRLNVNTFLAPPGVDHALFAQALQGDFPIAEPLRGLPRPIVGFYGSLYDWVDQELIVGMATLRPQWSFVLVGKIMCDVSALRRCQNIHLISARPFEDLPQFCKGFDVGVIPYRFQDSRTKGLNPIKLREYISAGLPVVSIEIPEVRSLAELVSIAHNAEEFIERIESAIEQDSPAKRIERSERMKFETWSARVAAIESVLDRVSARDGASAQ